MPSKPVSSPSPGRIPLNPSIRPCACSSDCPWSWPGSIVVVADAALEPITAQPQGSLARQFLSAWHDREPAPGEVNALDRSFVLIADHELNAATFAARVAASTGADICSAVLAAVATQSGPLHGGAVQSTGELLSAATPEQAAAGVLRRLDAGERIPGFGHPVYRRGDPRVPLFRLLAEDLAVQTGDDRHLDAADRIAAIMADRKGLPPNMDLYAAACWLSLGIPADLFPAIFALGRLAGWIAHIREQYCRQPPHPPPRPLRRPDHPALRPDRGTAIGWGSVSDSERPVHVPPNTRRLRKRSFTRLVGSPVLLLLVQ